MKILGWIWNSLGARIGAGESGQALVETSLVFIFLVVPIVIGTADLAQVAYSSIAVENAAKAAVQYGCQNGFTAQDSTGMQTVASDEATGLTVTLSPAPSSSCICSDGTSSTCQNTDCPNSHIEQSLTVSTSATITPAIHLPLLPSSYTVKGSATQRVGQ